MCRDTSSETEEILGASVTSLESSTNEDVSQVPEHQQQQNNGSLAERRQTLENITNVTQPGVCCSSKRNHACSV